MLLNSDIDTGSIAAIDSGAYTPMTSKPLPPRDFFGLVGAIGPAATRRAVRCPGQ